MNLLLLSATRGEIAPSIPTLHSWSGKQVDILITGIGCAATTYHLTRQLLQKKYDLVLHAGIAGSFSEEHPVGSIVQIQEDCFGALGVEDRDTFIPAREAGFTADRPYTEGMLINPAPPLPGLAAVRGITVDTVSGSQAAVLRLTSLFHPEVETMESAACFYVCLSQQQPFYSVRSISNTVGPRNRNEWKVVPAIEALNTTLAHLLKIL